MGRLERRKQAASAKRSRELFRGSFAEVSNTDYGQALARMTSRRSKLAADQKAADEKAAEQRQHAAEQAAKDDAERRQERQHAAAERRAVNERSGAVVRELYAQAQ